MKFIRAFLFLLLSLVFAAVGGMALWTHVNSHLMRAEENANDSRLSVQRVKQMAATVQEFQKLQGRLPTSREVSCDWKPCEQFTIWVWRVVPGSNGDFSLTYTSIGVPFTPAGGYDVTWRSRDGSTDRDDLTEAWQWRLWLVPKALVDIVIILAPWLFLMAFRIWRSREKKA